MNEYIYPGYQGYATASPTVVNCPQNIYREIPEGTSTRVCWEEPFLTDETGNPIETEYIHQTHHSGSEFFINGCNEQVVHYTFYDYYGTTTYCSFSVTIRASGKS